MRAVIQRVSSAKVTIEGTVNGEIGKGLLVLLGVCDSDEEKDLEYIVEKTVGLRIFEDEQGKMNKALEEIGGSILVVSQFTLYGDARKGKRPSFIQAARPEKAIPLYEKFIEKCKSLGINVQTGEFGADMKVDLCNDGPVTIILDSSKIL